jgi:hypothetical protein
MIKIKFQTKKYLKKLEELQRYQKIVQKFSPKCSKFLIDSFQKPNRKKYEKEIKYLLKSYKKFWRLK